MTFFFLILLSGSPYSWETVLSFTTIVKSVMVTLGNTRVHLLTSSTPNSAEGRSSYILGRLQRCMRNVFIPGTLAYISAYHMNIVSWALFFSNVKRSSSSRLQASIFIL